MSSPIQITVAAPMAGTVKAALAGELDEEAVDKVKAALDPTLNDASVKNLMLVLSQLLFMNSKGIGLLVSMHTHLAKLGRRLVLAGAQEAVMDVMNLVGLTSIIPYYESEAEAVAALQR